ncbi:MAG: putative aminohydrolase SsnA [Oligoflexia bacterium]|nr:putative aminohydrolase SsnA [Oligoflexia bacterium]
MSPIASNTVNMPSDNKILNKCTNNLIIKNATVVTLGIDNKILFNHTIVVEHGVITQIVPNEQLNLSGDDSDNADDDFLNSDDENGDGPGAGEKGIKIIDAEGKIVMPGFINTHMHFYSTFACGLIKANPSLNFQQILKNLWWRLDKNLLLEDSYYSALSVIITAIKKGTTTFFDHHASPSFSGLRGSLNEIANAVLYSGVRANLCYELSDRDGEELSNEGIEENINFIKKITDKIKNEPNSKEAHYLRAMFGLHASFTLTDETLEKAVSRLRSLFKDSSNSSNLSNSTNPYLNEIGFHIHTAEDISDQNVTEHLYGKRVVKRLHDLQILGANSICAHAIHLSDEELDLIKKTNTMVVHNPQSNMNNAVGVADIFKMKEKGILVGLGTDAMTVNMLEELRSGIWVHRITQKNPNVGFVELTEALIKNNPQIANRFWKDYKLGELSPGAQADIIIFDYYPSTELTSNNFYGHLVFGLSQGAVDTTIVAGKVLMENKKILHIDELYLSKEAQRCSRALWERF